VNSVLRTLVMAVFTFCALYILVEFLGKEPRKGVVFVGKLGNQTQLKTVTKELEMNNIKSFFLTRDITESR
jgi:ATP-dependent RNA circularization protein (DNA/RNA ligase family)